MADLSHWDFALDFTGEESASLIAGVDLAKNGSECERAAPILDRMKRSYELARGYYRDIYMADTSELDPDLPFEAMESLDMRRKVGQVTNRVEEVRFAEWLLEDASDFELQRFSREQLSDWLDAIGLTSVYPLDPPLPTINTSPLDKPLLTRERNVLLIIIAVLCKNAKLDYATSSKTADLIEGMAKEMDISISKNAIRDHLKKIPNVLGSRTK